jgi:hypothetical protein
MTVWVEPRGSSWRRERPVSAHRRQPSDHDPLDLIEAELVAPAIVELRRARRGVVRHRRGLFQRAAVLEIGRDARRPEAVVAELGRDAGRGQVSTLEQLAEIPEEEIWLQKQKSARTRRAYRLDVQHSMRTLSITMARQQASARPHFTGSIRCS